MRAHHNDKTNGMRLALLIYLCTFCAVFAGFISVLHTALQPTVLPNPGLSAYKAPAGTALYPQRVPPEPEWQEATDETASQPPPAPAASPDKQHPPKQARQKPSRTTQRIARQRNEQNRMMGYTTMGYAAPDNYFRPWF
jgi:hypothetical protein